MPRTINATTFSALEGDHFKFAHLLYFGFTSSVYITDYAHDIVYDSNTYEAAGHLLGISDPIESRELRVGSLGVRLSGVDKAYISIFLGQEFINRQFKLRVAVIGSDGLIAGDPITTFDGLLTNFQIDEGTDTCEISVSAASHWADFKRKNGRITNNNSQQFHFAGDKGMNFAAKSTKNIKWGKN